MNLTNATVTGFFSLPSPALAETNPGAYNAQLAEAPARAGSCGHCGTGIIHHVIIRLETGLRVFIGTSCAEKVGQERVRQCVRARLTEDQLAAREAKAEEHRVAQQAWIGIVAAERAVRYEQFKDVVDTLRAQGSEFFSSLASQLIDGPLSDRQACYAVKAIVGRETKKNSEQWWDLYERITKEENS